MSPLQNWEQHPKVRNLTVCIECQGDKPQGLLVCWRCHDNMKRANDDGYDPVVVACFDLIDAGKVYVVEQGEHKGRIFACV